MPQHQRAWSRPEKWTERVVYCCTYFHKDHMEQLLDFRREYRRHRKRFGVTVAKRYARKQAVLWTVLTVKEAIIWLLLLGKRLFATG